MEATESIVRINTGLILAQFIILTAMLGIVIWAYFKWREDNKDQAERTTPPAPIIPPKPKATWVRMGMEDEETIQPDPVEMEVTEPEVITPEPEIKPTNQPEPSELEQMMDSILKGKETLTVEDVRNYEKLFNIPADKWYQRFLFLKNL